MAVGFSMMSDELTFTFFYQGLPKFSLRVVDVVCEFDSIGCLAFLALLCHLSTLFHGHIYVKIK